MRCRFCRKPIPFRADHAGRVLKCKKCKAGNRVTAERLAEARADRRKQNERE
jgi:phage FluMu protein Com